MPWPLRLTGERLEELFRRKLLSLLLRRQRVSETTVGRLLTWSPTGFSAWVGAPIEPEQKESRQRLARYLVRPVVSLERLTYDAVRCQVEVRSDTRGERRTLSALDFVAELSVHVPDRRRHTVHYLGRCSSRSRGKRLRAQAQAEEGASDSSSSESSGAPPVVENTSTSPAPGPLSRKAFRRSWAELLKKVWNIDASRIIDDERDPRLDDDWPTDPPFADD